MSSQRLPGAALAQAVLLNRAVYGGDDDLASVYRSDYDQGRDPSDAGIRPELNVYDRYDRYLATQGLTTLGAAELGFTAATSSTSDDLVPGDGMGIDRNWFYAGDLYRNHVSVQANRTEVIYPDAAAVALAATAQNDTGRTLHLAFRGTDADLGKDGEAGTALGQSRYFGQLIPLIEAALAFAADPANAVTEVVVSGHSLGGSMADLFSLYYGAAFDALPGVDLQVVSLASAGIDPGVLALRPDFDASLVSLGLGGLALETPDWYASYDHAGDIVRNPERYDYVRHLLSDPQQAPITLLATTTLREHLHFEENRLSVEVPLLDQYALSTKLETNFLPQHYASLYEMVGDAMAESVQEAQALRIDRIIALGGRNSALEGLAGTNNANAFGLPQDNRWTTPEDGRAVWVLGLSGRDSLTGASRADLLDGGSGDDVLAGAGGDDVLMGQDGHDTLSGGAGPDRLIGGTGSDALAGGTGADVFVFSQAFGTDVVRDFQNGIDRVDLTFLRDLKAGAPAVLSDLLLRNDKGGTTIQLDLNRDRRADVIDLDRDGRGDEASIHLAGLSPRIVDPSDFLF